MSYQRDERTGKGGQASILSVRASQDDWQNSSIHTLLQYNLIENHRFIGHENQLMNSHDLCFHQARF